MIFDITECEERIGYVFKNKMLLRQCFTHTSYAHEHQTDDNELLEFFGDSIIEFVVTEYLYKNAYGDEGVLTKERAKIVSREPLLKIVDLLRLDDFILFGSGQENALNKTEKLFSSLYEALVAGIYIDGGIVQAKKFIMNTLIKAYKKGIIGGEKKKEKSTAEAKSMLQEYVQKRKLGSIAYEDLYKKGPDNRPEFRVAVTLNGTRLAEGVGSSKKQAQSKAAKKALESLIEKSKRKGGKKH